MHTSDLIHKKLHSDNVKVRQAISLMIKKDEIIEGVYDGFGITAKGPLAPGIFGYNEKAKEKNITLEEAKKLMKEAGFENGFKTSIWTNDNPQRKDIAILLKDSLKDINVDVEIEEVEWGAYLEKTANGEHDMFILGWSNPTGDADYGYVCIIPLITTR